MAGDPFDFANASPSGTSTAKISDPFDFAGTSTPQPELGAGNPIETGTPIGTTPGMGAGTASYLVQNPDAMQNGMISADRTGNIFKDTLTSIQNKPILGALGMATAVPGNAIAGGLEAISNNIINPSPDVSPVGKNPFTAAWDQSLGKDMLDARGYSGIIASASNTPIEKLSAGQRLAGGLADAVLTPVNFLGGGMLSDTGKIAEKSGDLVSGLRNQVAEGQRTALGLSVPFANKTLPLLPNSASKAIFNVAGGAKDAWLSTKSGQALNSLFNTNAGLPADLAKMKTLEYDGPRNQIDEERGDYLRARQAEMAKTSIASGLKPEEINKQVLAYNELPLKFNKQAELQQVQRKMEESMHPSVLSMAKDRQAMFKSLESTDKNLGETYPSLKGYEPHHATFEYNEYRNADPSRQKLFSDFFKPGQHRGISQSILDSNALSEAGAHPAAPGFKGKMFEDDISKTYADRVTATKHNMNTADFYNSVAKKYGMTPEAYEAARTESPKSGVKPGDYSPFRSKYYGLEAPDANGYQRPKAMMLPQGIAKNLKSSEETYKANPFWQAITSWLKPLNAAWRPMQIATPANIFRDVYMNYPGNALTEGTIRPDEMFRQLPTARYLSYASLGRNDGSKLASMKFNIGGETIDGKQAIDKLRKMAFTGGQSEYLRGSYVDQSQTMRGQIKSGLNKAEMNWKQGEPVGKIKSVANLPDAALKAFAQNPYFKAYFNVRLPEENAMRAAYTLALWKKGFNEAAATLKTKDVMWDWKQLTPFQQNVVREVMPFAVWGMKNLPYQSKMLLQYPGRLLGYERFKEGVGGQKQKQDEKYFNDWYKKSDSVRLGGPSQSPLYAHLGGWWAPSDLNEVADPLHYLANQLAPAIQLPIEMFNNKSMFFNEPLEKFTGEKVPYSIPGVGKVPVSARYAKPLLDEFLPLNAWNRAAKIPLWSEMLRAGTGLNIQPLDMDKAQGAKRAENGKADIQQKENVRRQTYKLQSAIASGDQGDADVARENLQNLRKGQQSSTAPVFDPFNFAGGGQ